MSAATVMPNTKTMINHEEEVLLDYDSQEEAQGPTPYGQISLKQELAQSFGMITSSMGVYRPKSPIYNAASPAFHHEEVILLESPSDEDEYIGETPDEPVDGAEKVKAAAAKQSSKTLDGAASKLQEISRKRDSNDDDEEDEDAVSKRRKLDGKRKEKKKKSRLEVIGGIGPDMDIAALVLKDIGMGDDDDEEDDEEDEEEEKDEVQKCDWPEELVNFIQNIFGMPKEETLPKDAEKYKVFITEHDEMHKVHVCDTYEKMRKMVEDCFCVIVGENSMENEPAFFEPFENSLIEAYRAVMYHRMREAAMEVGELSKEDQEKYESVKIPGDLLEDDDYDLEEGLDGGYNTDLISGQLVEVAVQLASIADMVGTLGSMAEAMDMDGKVMFILAYGQKN